MTTTPRIALISALAQSPGPAAAAMDEAWPEARYHNLIDDSLAGDFATLGEITPAIVERFLTLGRYAASVSDGVKSPDAIMFTCSAFRPAIDRVKADLAIPVISPNEGAFDEALDICAGKEGGGRIAVLLTFMGSLAPLTGEIEAIAKARGQEVPEIIGAVAEGALEALQAGDAEAHDRMAAEAAAKIPPVDVIVIGQFSMARALPLVVAQRSEPVLTTPHAAVRKLRRLVEARGA
ncbi:MAG: arylsulfatase [Novosphingobium sp.]|nr:arylsulfatase [Novosphingobium sp.]